MKIAFVNDSIYKYASGALSAVGGAERQQWLIARALAALGWSVCVGITEGVVPGGRLVIDGVEFIGIGKGRGHILSAWYRFLSAERPDWFYWRCANHLLGPAFALARWLRIGTIFAAALDSDVNARHALVYRPRWWPLYAWGLAWADRIFVQHRSQLVELKPKLRSKAYIVPNIAGGIESVKAHAHRGKYIAWVGQLRYAKRPDLLIEIAQNLPEIHFIVCGGPCDFGSPPGYPQCVVDKLRGLPNVEYRGQVAPRDAVQIIADAAILLSTSDEEGFPNTFLQAWSAGTPVISLKIDPGDVIKQTGLGIVSGSIGRTAVDLRSLVDSVQCRSEVAARSVRYVAEYHSEAAVTASFVRAIFQTRLPIVMPLSSSQIYSNQSR